MSASVNALLDGLEQCLSGKPDAMDISVARTTVHSLRRECDALTTALADYYAVGDTKLVTVRHGCHPERPFSCLTCLKNDCEHIDAVEVFIAAGGAPKEAMVAA